MANVETKAIVFPAAGEVACVPTSVRDAGPGEVRIRTTRSCVSPGTELRILAGEEHGPPTWPKASGYALFGEIEQADGGSGFAVGDRVVTTSSRDDADLPRGGHIGYAVTSADRVVRVPDGVDDDAAAIARVLAIGHRAARLAAPRLGEQVAVVGLGIIGLAAAMSLRLTGARVACFNRSPDRVELAHRLGLDAHAVEGDLAETVKAVLPGGADVLFDATGSPKTPAIAVEAVRDLTWDHPTTGTARYVVLGSHAGPSPMPYHPAFFRELAVLFPRFTDDRDTEEMLRLLAAGVIDPAPMLADTHFTPEQAGEVFAGLRDRKPGLLTAVFRWD
jgi:2-desacetyl-2-hydroxyethyl bacteriochlorophyllide A dehydrogenase